ncbi:hypothetical protein BH11PLA2_BH11PLA2_06340 [soil metagenome]
MTEYPVPCSCGVVHRVPSTQAGSVMTCTCGQKVPVPSLGRLKSSAGESALSPQFEIKQRNALKELPEESTCWSCEQETDHIVKVRFECEKIMTEAKMDPKASGMLTLNFGLFGFLFSKAMAARGPGRSFDDDHLLDLPVRCCRECEKKLIDTKSIKEALRRTPLYSDVIGKFPKGKVSIPM